MNIVSPSEIYATKVEMENVLMMNDDDDDELESSFGHSCCETFGLVKEFHESAAVPASVPLSFS